MAAGGEGSSGFTSKSQDCNGKDSHSKRGQWLAVGCGAGKLMLGASCMAGRIRSLCLAKDIRID